MIMKTQIKKIIFLIFLITLTFSCSKNEDVDSTPPGILSNISVVPTNGGEGRWSMGSQIFCW